jgi:hypothetical protein
LNCDVVSAAQEAATVYPLLSWHIYLAAAKGKLLGTIEAADVGAVIEAAAIEFKTDARKLIAVRRR